MFVSSEFYIDTANVVRRLTVDALPRLEGSKPHQAANVLGAGAILSVGPDRTGVVALCEPFAVLVADQPVVVVDWRGEAQEALEEDVDLGGIIEVFAPDHVGDALGGIVDDHGEVIDVPMSRRARTTSPAV